MIGGKKYNFNFSADEVFLTTWDGDAGLAQLNKRNTEQVKNQLEGQQKANKIAERNKYINPSGMPPELMAISETIIDAVQEPFKTIGKGLEQLGRPIIGTGGIPIAVEPGANPIAGAINLATGIAEIPMLIGTVPLSAISKGLEELGMGAIVEPVNKAFETIQSAPKNAAEEISEALEKNGLAREIRGFVDSMGSQFGITPGTLRISEEKATETNEAINNLTGLASIVGVGLLGGYFKTTKGMVSAQKRLIEQGLPKEEVLKMKPKEILQKLDDASKEDLYKVAVEDARLEKIASEQTKKELIPDAQKQTADLPSLEEVKTAEKPRVKIYGTLEKVKEIAEKPLEQISTNDIPKVSEIKKAKSELLKTNQDPETIGITVGKLNELRDKKGLPELEKTARQHIPEEMNKVLAEIDAGVRTPERLVQEITSRKETASQAFEATYHLTKENNKLDNIMSEINDARTSGDVGLVKTLQLAANESISKIDMMTKAVRGVDKDWGRYGRYIQEQMAKDYSASRLISRAQAKSPDGNIPDVVKTKLVGYSSELSKVSEAINKYQKKFPERTIDDFIKDIQRQESFTQRKQQRAVTKDQLKVEREQLWTDLYKATSVSASNIPLTPEAIKVMGRLAENYVRTGITTAQGLVDEFYTGFQGKVSKEDIMKAISGYGLEKKKPTRTELQQQLGNAKKEIKLLLQIEDAKKGQYLTRGERKPQPERITELQQQLRNIKKEDVDLSDGIKLRAQKTRSINSIRELERKLKEKDYAVEEKRKIEPDRELTDLRMQERELKKKVELELYRLERMNLTKWQRTKELGVEIANIPRTLLATFDLSMPLRQGLPATFSDPKIGYKAFKEMHKAAGSPKYFNEIMTKIENSPTARTKEKMGVQYTGVGEDLVSLAKREESFIASKILNRIPIVKQTLGAGIRFSERGAVANLNVLRDMYADKMIKSFEAKGMTLENNLKAYQDAGQLINWMTGRASLGAFEKIPGIANAVLFSPRNFVAKWQMMNPANYVLLDKVVRKQFMRAQVATVMQGMTLLNMAKLAGMEVETDPRSSDFAKARIGNTRLDFFGGMQQNMVFATRFAFGIFGQPAVKTLSTGEIYKLNTGGFNDKTLLGLIGQYGRNKLSPQTALVVDYLSGKTTMGENTSDNFKNEPLGRFIPLVWQDMLESQAELGWGAIGTTALGFYGAGSQTFKLRQPKTKIKEFNPAKGFDFDIDIKIK